MTDWPSDRYHKTTISTWSVEAISTNLAAEGMVPANATWPSANFAVFVPFVLGGNFLVRKVWWTNGATVAGNVDCGVYTSEATKLFSSGSTAQAGTNTQQSVDITDYRLTPGSYYFALVASSTTATFYRLAATLRNEISAGVAGQATALPLPATATLVQTNQNCVPLCGITSGTVL